MMVSTAFIRFGFKSFLSFSQSNDGRHSFKMVLNGHLGDGLVFLAWPAVGCGHLAIIFVVLLLFVHLGHQACCNIILHHRWCRQLHLVLLQPPIIDHLAVFACAVGHKKGLLQCNDTFKRRQATLHWFKWRRYQLQKRAYYNDTFKRKLGWHSFAKSF